LIASHPIYQKILQGTVHLDQKIPPSGNLKELLEKKTLIEDSEFQNAVAPKEDSIQWRKISCSSFNSFLVVVDNRTYWGSPENTLWAIQHLEGARPAFPHIDDL